MPQLACTCGFSFDLITIPSPQGFRIITEEDIDRLTGISTEKEVVLWIWRHGRQGYNCPKCQRLAFVDERNRVSHYKLEDGRRVR
jgi:hypothetical protein